MLRPSRPVSLVLAALFFFGPAGAYAAGVRATAIENHPLRALPGLSAGWKFFADMSAWSIDHLPLRVQAVRTNVALNERVFGQPPVYGSGDSGPVNAPTQAPPAGQSGVAGTPGQSGTAGVTYPRVIQGTDGWLYFGGDIAGACNPRLSIPEVMSRLNRLAAAVDRSGRRFVFTVAPDKSTVVPEHLPATYLGKDCATARKAKFWSALSSNPPTGYFDMRRFIEVRQHGRGALYWKTDSHWGEQISAQYAYRLATHVDPTAFRSDSIQVPCSGNTTHLGDLGVILGKPRTDTMLGCSLKIGGSGLIRLHSPVVPGPGMPAFGSVPSRASTDYGAEVGVHEIDTPTLLLGDSFSSAARPYLLPLFGNLTLLHNQTAGLSPQRVADAMVKSRVVAFEIVERTIIGGAGSFIDERTVEAVEKAMKAHPVRR